MGRAPCCAKVGLHRGPWTVREDTLLTNYIQTHGEGNWRSLPKEAGLLRCGKSCRLRWMNYLRPDIKRGNIAPDEDDLIIRLHSLLGNRWSLIAGRLPGRTDNEIKNYWNSHLSKRLIKNHDHGKELATPNTTTSRKNRSTNSRKNSKKPQNNKNNQTVPIAEDTTRTKIHLPKPTRLPSFVHDYWNISTAVETTSNSSDIAKLGIASSEGKGDDSTMDDLEISWSAFEKGDILVEEDDSRNALACDFPVEDNMLEKIYEEYSQLLDSEEGQFHLNSFAESLLV